VDAEVAARRWAETWERGWREHDAEEIARVYADDAVYRSHPFHAPVEGGALAYAREQFAQEGPLELVRFGEPIVSGDRAAVEWWATFEERGKLVTLAGATVLRFRPDGLVAEHVDYWVMEEGRVEPPAGWGR
jgi:SnoaL-like domain